jgi:hypothetical protein
MLKRLVFCFEGVDMLEEVHPSFSEMTSPVGILPKLARVEREKIEMSHKKNALRTITRFQLQSQYFFL